MPRVNVIQASLLYKVTNRTVYNWIMEMLDAQMD